MATTLTRRQLLALSGGAAAAAALAACGSPVPTAAPAPSDQPAPRTPSELVIANEAEPTDLMPYVSGFAGWLVDRGIYETLAENRTTITPNGVVEVVWAPRLAVRWERVDPTRWRFSLRPGVTFHNGEVWNAQAAKASFDALANRDLAAQLRKTAILARYAGCEIVDEMTIDITTRAPDAEALSFLRIGFVGLPPKLLAEKGVQAFAENPVGTGPFRFARWIRGQEIRLERHAGYWNPNVTNVPAIRHIFRPEAAIRAQTIRAGEAGFAYNIGGELAAGLRNSVIGGGFQSSGIRLNNQIAPTNDVRVRRALNLAIDRNAIVQSIFRGAATPIAFFGFQPVKLDPFPYQPDEARRLIDEAGVRGQTLEFVYGETRIPEEDQLAEVYKNAFEAIGLRIALRKLEPRQYNEVGMRPFPEQPPLYMETTSSGNYGEIAAGLMDKYGSQGTGTFAKPEYDAEFARLANLEGAERVALLQRIAERLHTIEVPRVWVVAVRQAHGLADNVRANLPANAYLLVEDLKFA